MYSAKNGSEKLPGSVGSQGEEDKDGPSATVVLLPLLLRLTGDTPRWGLGFRLRLIIRLILLRSLLFHSFRGPATRKPGGHLTEPRFFTIFRFFGLHVGLLLG